MNDTIFLITIWMLFVSIYFDIYRVRQMKSYLEQNKKILVEMELKRKELYEVSILFSQIEEIHETKNE
jgi:predicted Holliday junction resolvase-like endonuclease